MGNTNLHFAKTGTCTADSNALMIVASKENLENADFSKYLPEGIEGLWDAMVESLSPADTGVTTSTWLPGEEPTQLVIGAFPKHCSRHNSPSHPRALMEMLGSLPKKDIVDLVVMLDKGEYALATAASVARALPLYSVKTKKNDEEEKEDNEPEKDKNVYVHLVTSDGPIEELARVQYTAEAVRLAGEMVDRPTAELYTDIVVDEAKALAEELGVEINVIQGEELRDKGFGGLWGVGKAAEAPPALVCLSYKAKAPSRTVVWVGKGIVYDTGGLSLKPTTGMAGMKADMAGAAGVFAAFKAAVQSSFSDDLHAILCLAENAIGPKATRPDDILHMYSGRTVEINNTDAEGRLVLADGVAYAVKHLNPDVIVDMATLTGAQLLATGKQHAGIICNDEGLEKAAWEAGRKSGDLVHPLPYCPEMFRATFKSEVADLKNSVKDRMNAQTSCAAQFVAEHLCDYEKPWLHIDIAGPSTHKERGTGFGVPLLLTLFG